MPIEAAYEPGVDVLQESLNDCAVVIDNQPLYIELKEIRSGSDSFRVESPHRVGTLWAFIHAVDPDVIGRVGRKRCHDLVHIPNRFGFEHHMLEHGAEDGALPLIRRLVEPLL
jgi:hypothetical protein